MSLLWDLIVHLIELHYHVFWSIHNFFRQFIFPKKKDVSNKIVVITGAGSGIGQLLCLRFAHLSARVVGWDVNEAGLKKTRDMVEKQTGQKLHYYVCDCSKPDTIRKCADQVHDDVGPVSILINNAGVVVGKTILELTDADIDLTFRVNALAHFWTTRAFLRVMLSHNRGHIVAVSSMAAHNAAPGLSDYTASKAACSQFMEALQMELHQMGCSQNIKTTLVEPYHIATNLFKGCISKLNFLFPTLTPEYVADRIVAGILSDQKVLRISRIMYLSPFLKSILPADCLISSYKFTGTLDFMKTFKKSA